jgi:hypothetical protein
MAQEFEPQSKSFADWLAERANRSDGRLTELEIAVLGKVWVSPGILTGIYAYQNGYGDAGGTERNFQYRLYDKDRLQFHGTLVAGTNNAVAFTLLPPFWPTVGDIHIIGTVLGTSLTIARFDISSVNGQVSVTYI